MKFSLSVFILILSHQFSFAQEKHDSIAFQEAWQFNKKGMWTLTSWSLVNISSSIIASQTLDKTPNYFHQMNGMWNSVNLGLGTLGLISSYRTLKKNQWQNYPNGINKTIKSYKINFYIDFAYITSGALSWGLHQNTRNPDLAKGYGQSIITQGLFLLVFDYVMYKQLEKKVKKSQLK